LAGKMEDAYKLHPQGSLLAERLELLSNHVARADLAIASALDTRNGNDYFQRQWRADAFTLA